MAEARHVREQLKAALGELRIEAVLLHDTGAVGQLTIAKTPATSPPHISCRSGSSRSSGPRSLLRCGGLRSHRRGRGGRRGPQHLEVPLNRCAVAFNKRIRSSPVRIDVQQRRHPPRKRLAASPVQPRHAERLPRQHSQIRSISRSLCKIGFHTTAGMGTEHIAALQFSQQWQRKRASS